MDGHRPSERPRGNAINIYARGTPKERRDNVERKDFCRMECSVHGKKGSGIAIGIGSLDTRPNVGNRNVIPRDKTAAERLIARFLRPQLVIKLHEPRGCRCNALPWRRTSGALSNRPCQRRRGQLIARDGKSCACARARAGMRVMRVTHRQSGS